MTKAIVKRGGTAGEIMSHIGGLKTFAKSGIP
jgi:hypothetical protein